MDKRHTVGQTNLWRFPAPVSPRSGARSLTYLAQPSSQPEGRVCSLGKMLRANKHYKTVLTPHLDPEIDPFVGSTPPKGSPQRQFSPLDTHQGESNITQCPVDLGRPRQPRPHA
jgi:hypothetical protein